MIGVYVERQGKEVLLSPPNQNPRSFQGKYIV